jgi:acyl carrier protein
MTHASDDRIDELVREYAQARPPPGPLDAAASLRDDLGVESLALVSLIVRLGDELGVDAGEAALDMGGLVTVADLRALARRISERAVA